MGTAYTPGLKVSARTTIEKVRRLPLKGEVLVKEGDIVGPDTIVARTELPGIMQTIKLAEMMGAEPQEVLPALQVKVGDKIEKETIVAQSKGLFGLFKSEYKANCAGTLELISEHTGHLGVRLPPTPVERDAYVQGVVRKVIPTEGVVVECEGALIQGIFGVGGERQAVISIVSDGPGFPLTDTMINESHRGKVIVGGSNVSGGALRVAAEMGVQGIVVGGVIDRELIDYLRGALKDPGFDIGVAITGQEPIPFTLVVTEGFGTIPMAARTFDLLKSLEGKFASINGATQIRAGVIRPEVIVPLDGAAPVQKESAAEAGELKIGTMIRIIRDPHFGSLGSVTGLPPELVKVESETWVRVLQAKLQNGLEVTIPRANVEIIQG